MRLHQQNPETIVAMTMNIDFDGAGSPESLHEDVNKILVNLKATFLTVISSDSNDALYEKLKLASVPAVLVYDQTGQLRKRFDNDATEYGPEGFTYEEQIEPLVKELLAEAGN
ncbi:MAG: hypothetical protein QF918_06615 [Pirellulaceae bacterium]|nr:hypothetical protein [Pirellulaceae bacterium]MDP6555791.1 hypothetical protein [Pirellulaceae bacterium]